MLNERWVIL